MKPREGQLEIAEEVYRALKSGSRLLILAPTGYGKTLPILTAVKAFIEETGIKPIFWLVRSLSLGRRVAEDAELVGLKTFTAGGREKSCNLKLSGENIDPHKYCRYFRFKCEYYLNMGDLRGVYEVVEDYKDLLKLLPSQCCYFTQERIFVYFDIIVQNYFRRRHYGYLAVLDEAHNLLMPREKRVRISEITEAVATIETTTFISKNTIKSLESFIHRASVIPEENSVYVNNYLKDEEREELNNIFLELLYKRKLSEPVRKLIEIVNFEILYKENEELVGYRPPYIPNYNIALSASVPNSLIDFLRAEKVIKVPWNKLKAYIVNGLTTRYGIETFEEYRILLNWARRKFNKVLAIAPSRRVRKNLFSDYEETEEAVNFWREKGGLLTITARGKFSEGLDLDCDIVVMTGCPFLPPEISGYLRRSYRRLGIDESLAFKGPMLIATIQSIGRAYRGRGKKPIVLLADERYKKYSKELEEYFEIEEIELSKIIKSKPSY